MIYPQLGQHTSVMILVPAEISQDHLNIPEIKKHCTIYLIHYHKTEIHVKPIIFYLLFLQ